MLNQQSMSQESFLIPTANLFVNVNSIYIHLLTEDSRATNHCFVGEASFIVRGIYVWERWREKMDSLEEYRTRENTKKDA